MATSPYYYFCSLIKKTVYPFGGFDFDPFIKNKSGKYGRTDT